MWKKIRTSFFLAGQNIRARLMHTLLSVLGIVIGVAALVAILSLIDGMEEYAQDIMTRTTNLKTVMTRTETHKLVNGVQLKKDTYAYLTYGQFRELTASLTHPAYGFLECRQTNEVQLDGTGSTLGAFTLGTNALNPNITRLAYGQLYAETDVASGRALAVVNHPFASQAVGNDSLATIIGRTLTFRGQQVRVIGVLSPAEKGPSGPASVFVPITLFPEETLRESPPVCYVMAEQVEAVPALKMEVENFLKTSFGDGGADFTVMTNEWRVQQAAQGFLLFRIVMGLIVGISVLVGGIGVMNVLLISVTERTVEIGVRKAMGAKRLDILLQFLAESVSISLLGGLVGVLFGVLGTMVTIPVIRALSDAPFQASYTVSTFLIITTIAIVVGIVFGTYPAMRAARLDPVEAIRRE